MDFTSDTYTADDLRVAVEHAWEDGYIAGRRRALAEDGQLIGSERLRAVRTAAEMRADRIRLFADNAERLRERHGWPEYTGGPGDWPVEADGTRPGYAA